MKQQQNMSTCLFREKDTMLLHVLSACHGGSHFSATPLLSDVVKRHGLLMQKKNTHFLKMKCFERNEWWRESPFVETSNINSQRESSVGDKNQFQKVWSFPSAGTTKCKNWQTTSQMVCAYTVHLILSKMYYLIKLQCIKISAKITHQGDTIKMFMWTNEVMSLAQNTWQF